LQVRLWGDGATALPARVREIAAAADPVTRTFQVKADLGDAATHPVRLGQTASVRLALPALEQVTKLPLSALREDHGRSAVWVVDPARMTVASQAVTVAGADGNAAIIAAGLVPGQIVVTAGVHVLSPGQKVKFYAEPSAAPARAGAGAASAPR
jgi:RND family efflux transporter MFP subunit